MTAIWIAIAMMNGLLAYWQTLKLESLREETRKKQYDIQTGLEVK